MFRGEARSIPENAELFGPENGGEGRRRDENRSANYDWVIS
jgi:hypothetical protein